MNKTHSRPGARTVAALLVAGLASLAVPAIIEAQPAEVGDRELAVVIVYSGGIELRPLLEYREAIVHVAGKDYDRRLVFEPGDRIDVGTYDAEGDALGDGAYSWQLELVPEDAAARDMRIAATHNGGEAPDAWPKQAGSFVILGGSVASSDLGEIGSGPERQESGLQPSTLGSRSFSRAEAPLDDDAAVGSLEGVEAEVQADAARQAPPLVAGLGRDGFERSDNAAQALGQSPEQLLAEQLQQLRQQPGKTPVPRRTTSSDGADGRPRTDEDQ